MSWLSDVTGINLDARQAAASSGLAGVGGAVGGTVKNVMKGLSDAANVDMSEDAQQEAMKQAQQKQLADFKSNEGNFKNQLMGSAMQGERHRLAQGIQSAREGASRRGLLYSGAREDAEGAQQAQTGANLMRAKGAINQNVADTENKLRQNAIGAGFDQQQYVQQQKDNIYQQALANYQSNMQSNQAIGGIIGAGAGLALGGA